MSTKKQTRPSEAPTPVRFSASQTALIEETAEALGMSRQDVIRLSVSAGLKILRSLGQDGLANLIASQAKGRKP
jgi:hypothetical protein